MSDKLRICIAITGFYPYVGGAETQTLAQSQRLIERGHTVKVITFKHKRAWADEEAIKGVPVQRVGGAIMGDRQRFPRPLQRFFYLLGMLMISWQVWQQRKEYDILQVCQFSLLVLPLSLACFLAKKPMTIVVMSAGADKATKTKKAATLQAGPLDPTQEWLKVDGQTWIDGDLYGLQSAGKLAVRATQTLLLRIKAVVIVLSSRMRRYIEENDFEMPGMELIPNGVDIVRFQPTTDDDPERALKVVCVSKLRYEKGIDVLLQSWRLVQQQVPAARLIVIGNGPMQEQLERLARELNVRDSVEFAGLQSDIPGQLHRGQIGILPSRWEGMPNALLEAMAAGLACVATRVSGSEDLIDHGVNGLLVDSEDYQAMAQALITLLQNPELAREYGAAARQTVEQSYTLDYVTNRYVEVYHRMLARGGNHSNIIAKENYSLVS